MKLKTWLKKIDNDYEFFDGFRLNHKDITIILKPEYGSFVLEIYDTKVISELNGESKNPMAWDYYNNPTDSEKDLVEFAYKILLKEVDDRLSGLLNNLDKIIDSNILIHYNGLGKEIKNSNKDEIKNIEELNKEVKYKLQCVHMICEDK